MSTKAEIINDLLQMCDEFEAAASELLGDRTENLTCSDEVDDGIADAYYDVTARVRALVAGQINTQD